jgi:hypothetical protein
LWIFPVAPHLNNLHQIDVLEENIMAMHWTRDVTVSCPRPINIKVMEPLELTESDAPGFLHLLSIMRVTLPYLLVREHSVTWPHIKGFTEFLPLVNQGSKNLAKDKSTDPVIQAGRDTTDAKPVEGTTTPTKTVESSTKKAKGNAKL